jgi:hypothetical protein
MHFAALSPPRSAAALGKPALNRFSALEGLGGVGNVG